MVELVVATAGTAMIRSQTRRRRWYELVRAAQDDIAIIMTVESGKPLAESKNEIIGG